MLDYLCSILPSLTPIYIEMKGCSLFKEYEKTYQSYTWNSELYINTISLNYLCGLDLL